MKSGFIWGLCAAVSLFITSMFYLMERDASDQALTNQYLRLARQVADQVESLAKDAEAEDRREPLVWATSKVSYGVDPRLIRAYPATIPSTIAKNEVYELNREHQKFDYARVLSRETGSGVRIYIDTRFLGFAGATEPWVSDFLLVFIFVSLTLLGGFAYQLRTKGPNQEKVSEIWKNSVQNTQAWARFHKEVQSQLEHYQRMEPVMGKLNEFSEWAHRSATSFSGEGYDDPREILFQAERLKEYLSKLTLLTEKSRETLVTYNKSLEQALQEAPATVEPQDPSLGSAA